MTAAPTTTPNPQGTRQRLTARLKAAWLWLTAASPRVVEADRRRQAHLLAAVLITIIPLTLLGEVVTILTLVGVRDYTGYWVTLPALAALSVAYALSRTRHFDWGALLAIVVTSAAIFGGAASQPRSVLDGFLDFLLVPLLLGSIFLSRRQLLVVCAANLAGMLVLPTLVPAIALESVVIGPLIYIGLGAAILLLFTWHRDRLERDRADSIRQAEIRARQEAARTASLLRVAERLNAVMDLEAVLATMCEETAQVLASDTAIVFLYDNARAILSPAGSFGLPLGLALPAALPRAVHDQVVGALGHVAVMPHGLALTGFPGAEAFVVPETGSVMYATLVYEGQLVGSLVVISRMPKRDFSDDERLLLRGLADQSALAIVNTRLYKDARQRLERLQALRTIDIAITNNRDLQATLEVLLEQITHQLGVDAALVLLLDAAEQRLVYAAGRGFRTQALRATRLRLGDGRAGQAALQRRVLAVPDLAADLGGFVYAPLLGQEGFVSYFAAPLVAKDEVRGVLEVFHRAPLTPDPEWLDFLEALAGQAAIAIDNTTLLSDLKHSNAELAQAYDATIEGWSHALDLRDKETEGHTKRVTEMTLALARRVGRFGEAELVHLRRGALLHDIGKMGVPDSILLKPGPLTEAEWVVMRQHPVLAHEMLRPIDYLRPALDIPYAHHEKWDGTGYPGGLKGEQIPLAARLFAVVDIWDALRSDRPYRPAWPEDKVRAHLAGLAGSHLDQSLVAVFLKMLESPAEDGNLKTVAPADDYV